MYTFTDRSDRSLTLRPEGTAPIAAPTSSTACTASRSRRSSTRSRSMYRYGAPGRGRYREHWQLSVEAIGIGRSRDRRRDHPALRHAAAPARHRGLPPRAELDRLPRVPARLPRAARSWLAEHDAELDRGDAREGRDEPAARLRPRSKPRARRKLLETAPTIGDSLCEACVAHFAAVRADLDATGVALRARRRRSCAGSTTTPARPGSSSGRWTTRTRRSPAAAATTTSSRRSAGRRRRASASARGSSGC